MKSSAVRNKPSIFGPGFLYRSHFGIFVRLFTNICRRDEEVRTRPKRGVDKDGRRLGSNKRRPAGRTHDRTKRSVRPPRLPLLYRQIGTHLTIIIIIIWTEDVFGFFWKRRVTPRHIFKSDYLKKSLLSYARVRCN